MDEKQFFELTYPSYFKKLADYHPGRLAPIGFVGEFFAYFPEIIGGDMGCGILCVYLSLKDANFEALDKQMPEIVPCYEYVSKTSEEMEDLFYYGMDLAHGDPRIFGDYTTPKQYIAALRRFNKQFRGSVQLQSLGTGNHFVEIGCDSYRYHYLTVHSGSRTAGMNAFKQFYTVCYAFYHEQVYTYDTLFDKLVYQINYGSKAAVPLLLQDAFKAYVSKRFKERTPDILKFVTTAYYMDKLQLLPLPIEFESLYRYTAYFLVVTAYMNRCAIVKAVTTYLNCQVCRIVANYMHNFVYDRVVFKGAQLAAKDAPFIVALNCRDGILICKTEREQYAPHGAGRRISRSDAAQMTSERIQGVTRSWACAAEEPQSYKRAYDIENELLLSEIQIIDRLKPVYNYKHGK